MISDLLTDVIRARGPQGDFTFSGKEICDFVYSQARVMFESGAVVTVILCCDLQKWVPREKAVEQKNRDNNRDPDVKPYPVDIEFSDVGVCLPDSGTGVESEPTRMDIRCVMSNRVLRSALWRYVIDAWQDHKLAVPHGCRLVFDHFEEGAYVFTDEGRTLLSTPDNHFGEADLKIPYWVNRVSHAKEHIVVRSIDSDLMPILLHVYDCMPLQRRPKITLRYWQEWRCDIGTIHTHLTKKRGITIYEFMAMVVMCGTDYVVKKEILHGFGCDKLFEIFEEYQRVAPVRRRLGNIQVSISRFVNIVRFVYGKKWGYNTSVPDSSEKSGRRLVLASLERLWETSEHKGLRPGVPRSEMLRKAYNAICFNLQYWTLEWNDPKRFDMTFDAFTRNAVMVHPLSAPPRAAAPGLTAPASTPLFPPNASMLGARPDYKRAASYAPANGKVPKPVARRKTHDYNKSKEEVEEEDEFERDAFNPQVRKRPAETVTDPNLRTVKRTKNRRYDSHVH
ncbi:MAG: hypothetical protein JKY23_00460 [Nitrospinaceae bacterium]|nr:hypothetical protein [Nitrospinaceae bacterium]